MVYGGKVLTQENNDATYGVGLKKEGAVGSDEEDSSGGGTNLPPSGLVQVMSSGLTASTSPNVSCAEFLAKGYTLDTLKLRERFHAGSDVEGGKEEEEEEEEGSKEGRNAEEGENDGGEIRSEEEGDYRAADGVLRGASNAEEARACSALVGGSFATVEVEVNRKGQLRNIHVQLRDRHGHARHTKTIDAGSCRPL